MGEKLRISRLKQDIVEGDALIGNAIVHQEKLHSGLRIVSRRNRMLDRTDKRIDQDRKVRSAKIDLEVSLVGLSLNIKAGRTLTGKGNRSGPFRLGARQLLRFQLTPQNRQ